MKKRPFRKLLAALLVAAGASMFAAAGCVGEDPDGALSEPTDDEPIAETELAVGVGETCSLVGPPSLPPLCNSGLTCCMNDLFTGICRNLSNDKLNCGECGNRCYPTATSTCVEGECIPPL